MKIEICLTDAHVAAHFEMQMAGYYSGIEHGPLGSSYYFSEEIPSLSWNHGVNADPTSSKSVEFIRNSAKKWSRAPAFFVRERDIERVASDLGGAASIVRERWMLATRRSLSDQPHEGGLEVRFFEGGVPPEDFFFVLENLYDDEKLNDRFREFYVPTLRKSNPRIGVNVTHAVGYKNGAPVSCGSIYSVGSVSGLYSVGTISSSQSRGFGRNISIQLSRFALENGSDEVFLQCSIGTHVEKMYEAIGYISVECPALVTLK